MLTSFSPCNNEYSSSLFLTGTEEGRKAWVIKARKDGESPVLTYISVSPFQCAICKVVRNSCFLIVRMDTRVVFFQ